MLRKSNGQMKTGSTVSVEELIYLATNWRRMRLKHDDKDEVVDAHHDFFIKLTKREIQQSCTQFFKGDLQEKQKASRSRKKKCSEAAQELYWKHRAEA